MRKFILIIIFLTGSFSYSNFSDCMKNYYHALFYGDYKKIIFYGESLLNNFSSYLTNNEKDMIRESIAYSYKNLNQTNVSIRILKEIGYIFDEDDKVKEYVKHVDKKEKIKNNNDKVMLLLAFLFIIVFCLYLLYLEKIKKMSVGYEKL